MGGGNKKGVLAHGIDFCFQLYEIARRLSRH